MEHPHSSLAARLEKRLLYIGHSEQGEIPGHFREGKFVAKEQCLDDGSLIVPEDRSPFHIKRIANRENSGTLRCSADHLKLWPPGNSVEVGCGLTVKNWTVDSIKPDLSGPEMDPIVPVKMAFEFLAWHCGNDIYENPFPLASIRRQLIDGHLSKDDVLVERLGARNNRLFHGLVFEGNNPGARVQIRLFGSLAFRVEFSGLSISSTGYAYTHDLVSGCECHWTVT